MLLLIRIDLSVFLMHQNSLIKSLQMNFNQMIQLSPKYHYHFNSNQHLTINQNHFVYSQFNYLKSIPIHCFNLTLRFRLNFINFIEYVDYLFIIVLINEH